MSILVVPRPYCNWFVSVSDVSTSKDGICMGFGLGLACAAEFRLVTERSLLAMPECVIGITPDVGFAATAAFMTPGVGFLEGENFGILFLFWLFFCSMHSHRKNRGIARKHQGKPPTSQC